MPSATLCSHFARMLSGRGTIETEASGAYFRIVWWHGLADSEVRRYAAEFWKQANKDPASALFPEAMLQLTDDRWLTEIPSSAEAFFYVVNKRYIDFLIGKLGGGSDGRAFEQLFRSELGRYFVCECKDWKDAADFTSMAKFCRVLDSTKAKFGILFSSSGVSGKGKGTHAELEQIKVFQDRGIVIVVIDHKDIETVAAGTNFIALLRERYESIRLDIRN